MHLMNRPLDEAQSPAGTNAHWQQRDLRRNWHPCTQMQDHETIPLLPIKRGQGVWLEDFEGKRYLDAVSSWWVNIFGHANSHIAQAIAQQAQQLEHVIFAGCSHEPAVALSERLVQLAPPGLERVFYADNGSAAVEVALKLSYHYWYNRGQTKRHRYLTISNGYHGETLGALAVGDLGLYRDIYNPLLLDPLVVPAPDCTGLPRDQWEAASRAAFLHMEQALAENHQEICAVILEPLLQCAGGMRMYHPVYLKLLREACDRYGVLLIADEIASGFGRTGTLFACEQADITPDIMCLSKGITGGFLPLAAVLLKEHLYQAFYEDYNKGRSFLHSHSYTGNPIACAAALATLDLFEATPVLDQNQIKGQRMEDQVQVLRQHPHVGDIRRMGMVMAVEMMADPQKDEPYPWQERRGLKAYQHAIERGALLRPLGNVLYCMPPYVIENDEIDFMTQVLMESLEVATGVAV
jgi:adenosylmethionine-8-amino-7-oxononanoate aminotransferase